MNEVLDDIANKSSKEVNHLLVLILHGLIMLTAFILITILRLKVHALGIKLKDSHIHILGILIFIVILFNSFWIARKYFNSSNPTFSNNLIGLIGGGSVFLGNMMYRISLNMFYNFNGVSGHTIVPILFNSIILFGFGFFFTKARIKNLKKENLTTVILSLIAYFISFSLLIGGLENMS